MKQILQLFNENVMKRIRHQQIRVICKAFIRLSKSNYRKQNLDKTPKYSKLEMVSF